MDDSNITLKSYLNTDSSPHTVIDISVDKDWIPFDCLIDTGFNGFILLPLFYQKYFTEW